jgi:hypothetical protein
MNPRRKSSRMDNARVPQFQSLTLGRLFWLQFSFKRTGLLLRPCRYEEEFTRQRVSKRSN